MEAGYITAEAVTGVAAGTDNGPRGSEILLEITFVDVKLVQHSVQHWR
jgi:hypothetical protein